MVLFTRRRAAGISGRVLWEKLVGKWRPEGLPALSCEIELNDVEKTMDLLLKGANQGLTFVRMASV